MNIHSVNDLFSFICSFEPRSFYDLVGKDTYDQFRQELIELQIVWPFIHLTEEFTTTMFLDHREYYMNYIESRIPESQFLDYLTDYPEILSPIQHKDHQVLSVALLYLGE